MRALLSATCEGNKKLLAIPERSGQLMLKTASYTSKKKKKARFSFD